MNKRIQELAEQAGFQVSEVFGPMSGPYPIKEPLEKFAELIVRECCEVLRQEVEVALSADGDPVDPEGLVRKHFGVSE